MCSPIQQASCSQLMHRYAGNLVHTISPLIAVAYAYGSSFPDSHGALQMSQ